MLKIAAVILLGLLTPYSQELDCPDLTCASISYNGTCFLHDGGNPVMNIKFFACQGKNDICNIDDNNYAWYDTQLQKNHISTSPTDSTVPKKYIQAECVPAVSRR